MSQGPDFAKSAAHTSVPGGPVPTGQLAHLAELSSLLVATSDPLATLSQALRVGARLVPNVDQWRLYAVADAVAPGTRTQSAESDALDLLLRWPPTRTDTTAHVGEDQASAAPPAAATGGSRAAHGGPSALGLGAANDRRVLRQRHAVILGHTAGKRARAPHSPAAATAAYPLVNATGALVGALVAVAGVRHAWSHDELSLIELLAHHLSVLVTRHASVPVEPARMADKQDERLEFISLAAHELRSPLATVKGYAQLLMRAARKDPVGGANTLRSLRAIDQQVSRMADLIGELLDVVRIQRGKLETFPHAVELEPLVRHVVELRREQVEHHTITLEAPATPLLGMWDPERVEQITRDLLDNAIRFSQRGAIAVRITRAGTMSRVCVCDQGIGIPRAEREHIFEAFFRGAQARQRHLAGLGVGLFVSRAIAQRLGGRLWLERASEDEDGTGSEFCFELPLAGS